MSDLNFTDEEYTKPTRGEANRFVPIVTAIALKKNADGSPVAKGFVVTHAKVAKDADRATVAEVAATARQLRKAGELVDPPVTVYTKAVAVSVTETKLQFWTGTKISRPGKSADAPAEQTPEAPVVK